MIPIIKIKVLRKPVVKGKMDVRFPARVQVASPIVLSATGGLYSFSFDVNALRQSLDPLYEPKDGLVDQMVTAGASAAIANNTKTLRVNKTVGSATSLVLPLALAKTCDVLILDWKGDAGTNNITITCTGTEKINGLSSWTIAADNGSVFLRRIPGVGYGL